MDEAFSALDVLTGETLRNDMLKLWQDKKISTKGILIVSHNIEEAVMMADRIIVSPATLAPSVAKSRSICRARVMSMPSKCAP
jgi:ABC-type nitrate/sulfonate/bicarbonate transport system ATPase subunit